MVADNGITAPEIARAYDRSLHTVTKKWMQADDWPSSISRLGNLHLFDRAEVAAWVKKNRAADTDAPIRAGDPDQWLTAAEIAAETGRSPSTIRADFSRGRLGPKEGETVREGVKLWRRGTIRAQLDARPGQGRKRPGAEGIS